MRTLRFMWLFFVGLSVASVPSACSHLTRSSQVRINVSETTFVGSWEGVGDVEWRTNTFCRLELLPGGIGVCVENYSVVWPSPMVYRITSWEVNRWGRLVGTMRAMDETSHVPVRLVGWMVGEGMNLSINWGVEGGSVAHLSKVPALRDQMRLQAQQAKDYFSGARQKGKGVTLIAP